VAAPEAQEPRTGSETKLIEAGWQVAAQTALRNSSRDRYPFRDPRACFGETSARKYRLGNCIKIEGIKMFIKRIKIRSYQMGSYFRNDDFHALLPAGSHWLFGPFWNRRIQIVSGGCFGGGA